MDFRFHYVLEIYRYHDEVLIDVAQKLDELAKRQTKYEDLNEQIQEAHKEGSTQVSTTDPDARALPKKMNMIEVSYKCCHY